MISFRDFAKTCFSITAVFFTALLVLYGYHNGFDDIELTANLMLVIVTTLEASIILYETFSKRR